MMQIIANFSLDYFVYEFQLKNFQFFFVFLFYFMLKLSIEEEFLKHNYFTYCKRFGLRNIQFLFCLCFSLQIHFWLYLKVSKHHIIRILANNFPLEECGQRMIIKSIWIHLWFIFFFKAKIKSTYMHTCIHAHMPTYTYTYTYASIITQKRITNNWQ